MRLLRKKIPNSLDKEFVFCSMNDLNEIIKKARDKDFTTEQLKQFFIDLVNGSPVEKPTKQSGPNNKKVSSPVSNKVEQPKDQTAETGSKLSTEKTYINKYDDGDDY